MTRSTFRAATKPAGATRLSATSETRPMTARPCPIQRIRPASARIAMTASVTASAAIVIRTYSRSSVQP